jgi:hypothetical protein
MKNLTLTMAKVGPSESKDVSINLEDSLYRIHWPEIVKNLEEMKDLGDVEEHGQEFADMPCALTARRWKARLLLSGIAELIRLL